MLRLPGCALTWFFIWDSQGQFLPIRVRNEYFMKDKVYSFCPSPGGGGSPDRKDTMSRKDCQVGERSQNLGEFGNL